MNGTHTLDEWLAMICLAVSGYASLSAPWFVFVDADLADFDPRPALSRAVELGRVDGLLIAVSNARYAARDAAFSLAALLLLLSAPSAPEGAR